MIAWFLLGCGPTVPTYHVDLKPLIDNRCVGCHDTGGIGPFPLQNYAEVTDEMCVANLFISTR